MCPACSEWTVTLFDSLMAHYLQRQHEGLRCFNVNNAPDFQDRLPCWFDLSWTREEFEEWEYLFNDRDSFEDAYRQLCQELPKQ
ncbi:hypothetical protein KBC99_00810 [Candidatus Saccharibacteria bacterium]|nr:hypothetical protein [Candidatus Saccharibacteria bacterium]